MRHVTTDITPSHAAELLNKNLAKNRPIKQAVVDKYARDIEKGNWVLTHEAIALDTQGRLIDGQHRLLAIITSGETVRMRIAYDVPDDAFDHIDQGIPRSAMDVFKTQSRDWITKDHIAIARFLEGGETLQGHWSQRPLFSAFEIGEAVTRHREAIEFVMRNLKKSRKFVTPVKAAIAAAWYYEDDKDQLLRFMEVLASGRTIRDYDEIVIALREVVAKSVYGHSNRRILHLKACRAIKAFMDRERISRLYAVEPSPYPLPPRQEGRT